MEKMRFRALVLDHDDTVMDSTRHVHYPAFILGMEELRPAYASLSLDDFFLLNLKPGIVAFYREVIGLDDAEYQREYDIWQEYVREHIPAAFPAMARLIRRFHAAGGILCVSSHSVSANIYRDWEANGLPTPSAVYGWELPPDKRKPAPYALLEIMERFSLRAEEILVVDDLRFGFEMAECCGVPFAGAGWAYDVPEIRDYMRGVSERFFTEPEELERYIFCEDEKESWQM